MSPIHFIVWFLIISNVLLISSFENSRELIENSDERTKYCNRPWPQMEFFLPIGLNIKSKRNFEWRDIMLNSLEMFWPVKQSNLTIVLILDVELKNTELQHKYVDAVIANGTNKINFPKFRIEYHTTNLTYKTGHDRQQHFMFYADQFSG